MRSIITKYLRGKSTVDEQNELLRWIRKDEHLKEFQQTKEEWSSDLVKEDVPSEFVGDWRIIQNRMMEQLQEAVQRKQRTLNFFRYAAILMILIAVPAFLYILSSDQQASPLIYTTVAADYGQISKVVLPDSTVIWVNSGSTIKYNNEFSSSNRDIELIGEAYFNVHKNKDLPLVVASEDLRVKVLGTEFSVSAYPEEKNIQVVLEKGKIELAATSRANLKQEMKPGELVNFTKVNKEMVLSTVNTGLFTSWKDGIINIYNMPLSELVNKLEKRYNQKFEVDNEIKNLPYTFTIKNEKLSNILSLMEKITPVDVVQSGNVIELRYNQQKKQNKVN